MSTRVAEADQVAVGRRLAPVKAVTCTAAVALMLGATRWGSYIGLSPLFLTDLLIVAAVADRFLGRGLYGARHPVSPGYRTTQPALVVVLLVYVALRMLFSSSYVFTVTWLRDGVPYLYAVLALISSHSVARATPATKERTMKWVWFALIFHLAWVCGIAVVGSASLATPRLLLAGGIFDARPDIDSAVLGITAGLLVRRALLGHRRGYALLGLAAVGVGAAGFTSRAGFIAIAVCCVLGFGYAFVATGRLSFRRVAMVLMVPVVALAAITLLPSTTVGSRLVATIDPSRATSTAQENAVGTTDARHKTWHGVVTWTREDQARTLVGAGMGIDFLAASGTLQYLEGTDYENVRSPHDYFIGTFARLGLVGLGLILTLVLSLLRRAYAFRQRIAEDELLTFAVLTVFAVVSVASFGVVLEAPFGAVPFWWAAGLLLALVPIARTAEQASG